MAKIAYKCTRCKLRHMFRRKIESYIRQKKCVRCGHTTLHLDGERNRRNHIIGGDKYKCYCGNYPYPHRRGSKFCKHNANFDQNIEQEMGVGLMADILRMARIMEVPEDVGS